MRLCSVDGCLNAHHAKDFCGSHYARLGPGPKRTCVSCGTLFTNTKDPKAKACSWACRNKAFRQPVGPRFWPKVQEGEGCWEWKGARFQGKGYGLFSLNGSPVGAHRVSWQLTNGPIPKGMQVCHSCDNPPCVRPSHLFLGTSSDNARDAFGKGRR